ncbi:hypothetical protein Tco_0987435, partial [Tanacetum coccineum]
MDKKKFRIDTQVFHEILHICPRLPNQDFVEPPSKDEMVSFIKDLGYTGKCDMLSEIHTDHMHQPWRTFATGMFNQKNVDYVALLWEDFMFQADNREISFARKEHMPYPRFIKVIINHFISKDKTISMRNRINIHTVRNDTLLATPKKAMKFKKVSSPSKKLSPVLEEEPVEKPKRAKKPVNKSTTVPIAGAIIRDSLGVSVSNKKASAKVDRGKGIDLLSDVALLEAAQLKKTLKKSKLETHKLHASGSGDGVSSQPKVLDEQQDKTTGDSGEEDDDDEDESDDDKGNDDGDNDDDSANERTESDRDENPNLNQSSEEQEEEEYVDE